MTTHLLLYGPRHLLIEGDEAEIMGAEARRRLDVPEDHELYIQDASGVDPVLEAETKLRFTDTLILYSLPVSFDATSS